MDGIAATTETVILLLRFAMVAVLYLFLWQVIAVIWRDLRRPSPGETERDGRTAGRLVVVSSGPTAYQPGYAFPIHETATIGRSPENTVVLGDSFVSSNHAIIAFRDGGWWLSDLDARNGTWVNEERVSGETRIRPGDVLTIGHVKLKLAK